MKNPSPQKEEQLLLKKIAALKSQAEISQSAAQAARSKLASLQAEIDAQTGKLLLEQAATIKAKEAEFREYIFGVQQELEDEVKAIRPVKAEHEHLMKELRLFKSRKEELEQDIAALDEVKAMLLDKQGQITTLIDEVSKLHTQKLALENEIGALRTAKLDMQGEVNELKKRKMDTKHQYEEFKAEREAKVAEYESKILQLDHLVLQKRQEYAQFDINMDKTRADMADRSRALDNRDRGLRIREEKVLGSEARIQQNANLLNL